MPTRNDIISMAHRLLGVQSADENITADQESFGGAVLDAIYAELPTAHGLPIAWDLDSTPQRAFMGLSQVLASDLAQHYGQPYGPRSSGIMRLRAALISDDRPGAGDFSDGFVVSQGQGARLVFAIYPTDRILTGAAVVFSMRDEYGSTVIDSAAAVVVTPVGTPTVSYTFTTGDTANVGRFRGDFSVTYPDTTQETFPNLDKIKIFVTDPMGGVDDTKPEAVYY